MARLKYNDEVFTVSGGSVLETLLEHGHPIPNNCRAGACQSCLMQVTKGAVPEQAQQGLKDSQKARGFFLACRCQPEEDIDVCLPDAEQIRIPANVRQKTRLADDVVELTLEPTKPFSYRAGQYVTLWREDNLGRCYSLASVPEIDDMLVFHIRVIPGGKFSSWVDDDLQVGETLFLQGPAGDCFYTHGAVEQNLLLAGTGTGLAPLYGIIRDAVNRGHRGEIHLFHGALNASGLYLHDKLLELAQAHANVFYHPCVLHETQSQPESVVNQDICRVVADTVPKPEGWKAFLCGDQGLVLKLRKQIFLAGGKMSDIYADPFLHH